jgi:hypothetical protein
MSRNNVMTTIRETVSHCPIPGDVLLFILLLFE